MAGTRPADELVASDRLRVAEEGRVEGGHDVAFADQEGGADLAAGVNHDADRAQQRLVCGAVLAAVGDEDVGRRIAAEKLRA